VVERYRTASASFLPDDICSCVVQGADTSLIG
jgi:hypothetical protein